MKKIHNFNEIFDSQKLFRLILKSMSNPLETINIDEFSKKLFGNSPCFLAVAMTLLDNEVTFNAGENKELSENIISLTLSQQSEIQNADFIFLDDNNKLKDIISKAKCGTLKDPHKSATIIIKDTSMDINNLCLYGPGINGTKEFDITVTILNAIQIRDNQFYEYPCGIDFIFIKENGDMMSIPRLIKREVL